VQVEQQLSDCKEAGIYTLIKTFVEGLRDEEIKKEIRGKVTARKDLTMEKIIFDTTKYKHVRGLFKKGRQLIRGPGMALMQQQIGGMRRMPMQNRMGSISEITHPAIFHSNSTCYNCDTLGHHTVECPVLIIYKNCGSSGHKAIKCMGDLPLYYQYCGKPGHDVNIYWVANLSLRPSRGRGGRKKGERRERGGKRGGRGSTYRRGAVTTSVRYDTSIPQGGMASKSKNQNMVGVSRVSGQLLIKTVAATEYMITSTLNKLMDNVNVAVGTNKTYQSYIPHMFVDVKGRKMTKKELQSRGN